MAYFSSGVERTTGNRCSPGPSLSIINFPLLGSNFRKLTELCGHVTSECFELSECMMFSHWNLECHVVLDDMRQPLVADAHAFRYDMS